MGRAARTNGRAVRFDGAPGEKPDRDSGRNAAALGTAGYNTALAAVWGNQNEEGKKTMSKVRVLAGTRKGAFILTSDGKRDNCEVSGPHFAGWEMYHLKGSPADPDRIYASQSSGWF